MRRHQLRQAAGHGSPILTAGGRRLVANRFCRSAPFCYQLRTPPKFLREIAPTRREPSQPPIFRLLRRCLTHGIPVPGFQFARGKSIPYPHCIPGFDFGALRFDFLSRPRCASALAPVLRPNLVQDHGQANSCFGDLLVDGGRYGVHVLLRHLLIEFQQSRGDMVVIRA